MVFPLVHVRMHLSTHECIKNSIYRSIASICSLLTYLSAFIEGHNHNSSTITANSICFFKKVFLAFFQADAVHDTLALQRLQFNKKQAYEGCFSHLSFQTKRSNFLSTKIKTSYSKSTLLIKLEYKLNWNCSKDRMIIYWCQMTMFTR